MAINNRNEGRDRKPERNSKPGMPGDHRSSGSRQDQTVNFERNYSRKEEDINRLRDNDLYERQSI